MLVTDVSAHHTKIDRNGLVPVVREDNRFDAVTIIYIYVPRYVYTSTKMSVLSSKKAAGNSNNEGMRRKENEKKNNCMNEEVLCGGRMQRYKCHDICTSAKQKFRGII